MEAMITSHSIQTPSSSPPCMNRPLCALLVGLFGVLDGLFDDRLDALLHYPPDVFYYVFPDGHLDILPNGHL